MQPQKPKTLDPRAERLLEWMGAQSWAHLVVLGGGVALKHYLDYRGTKDCDAWWHGDARADEQKQIVGEVIAAMAQQNQGCEVRHRHFGEVDSVELFERSKAVFSFQIAVRTVQLAPYEPSGWGGVQIESLTDNLASKVSALVDRGYPRDFRDVFRAAHDLGFTPTELWALWQRKNPERKRFDSIALVRASLEGIIRRRPLDAIRDAAEQREARAVREWFLNVFLHDETGD